MDAEDLMSPLFHMPPSSACFYRVSSGLATTPSVYDKLRSWISQKDGDENSSDTSNQQGKLNPIFKSVTFQEILYLCRLEMKILKDNLTIARDCKREKC